MRKGNEEAKRVKKKKIGSNEEVKMRKLKNKKKQRRKY